MEPENHGTRGYAPAGAPPARRPAPVPDDASRPFFEAAAAGCLLVKHCPGCERHLAPDAEVCDACHSEGLEWREASGSGTLYSFVIEHRVLHPGFAADVPYTVIVVELQEGPRIKGSYAGEHADLLAGMALEVRFAKVGEVVVPVWGPGGRR